MAVHSKTERPGARRNVAGLYKPVYDIVWPTPTAPRPCNWP